MKATPMFRAVMLGAGLLFAAGALAACEEEGTAEQVGQDIDRATDNTGPAERAGKDIDDAVKKMEDKVDQAADDMKNTTSQ